MSWSDPVSDMLTRIRNAHMAGREIAEVPYSALKTEITKVLKREGYITDYTVEGGVRRTLRVYLKYSDEHEAAIRGLKRVSKPGLRNYVGCNEIPRVLGGLGVSILSTSAGVMTGKEARQAKIGGEVLCTVW